MIFHLQGRGFGGRGFGGRGFGGRGFGGVNGSLALVFHIRRAAGYQNVTIREMGLNLQLV